MRFNVLLVSYHFLILRFMYKLWSFNISISLTIFRRSGILSSIEIFRRNLVTFRSRVGSIMLQLTARTIPFLFPFVVFSFLSKFWVFDPMLEYIRVAPFYSNLIEPWPQVFHSKMWSSLRVRILFHFITKVNSFIVQIQHLGIGVFLFSSSFCCFFYDNLNYINLQNLPA